MGTENTTKGGRRDRTARFHAQNGAQIQKAHELRPTPTETEPPAWCVLRCSNVMVQEAPHLFVQNILDAVWSLPQAFG